MRRYDDPVEVRRGTLDEHGPQSPEQFLWRGRLWKVRTVLAHWVLGTDGSSVPARSPALSPEVGSLPERERWRVQAGRGGLETDGVFDLSLDPSDGSWQLAPVSRSTAPSLVGSQD